MRIRSSEITWNSYYISYAKIQMCFSYRLSSRLPMKKLFTTIFLLQLVFIFSTRNMCTSLIWSFVWILYTIVFMARMLFATKGAFHIEMNERGKRTTSVEMRTKEMWSEHVKDTEMAKHRITSNVLDLCTLQIPRMEEKSNRRIEKKNLM